MINGMKVALLAVLIVGFTGNSHTETLNEVEAKAEEIVSDVTGDPSIPLQKEPRCQNGHCVLDINVMKVPLVQSQLKGQLDFGYNGGEDNNVSGKSKFTYITKNGKEATFALTSQIDCEGEDKIKFRVGVGAGGTIKYHEIKGDLSKKLVPLCFPIPGAMVVSLCLYITKYKYDDMDKSLQLCMLIQLKVNLFVGVGFKIANLHSRCMFLRKEHFTQLNDKMRAGSSFAMKQANSIQDKLRSFSFRRRNSITGETIANDVIPVVDTPPAGK